MVPREGNNGRDHRKATAFLAESDTGEHRLQEHWMQVARQLVAGELEQELRERQLLNQTNPVLHAVRNYDWDGALAYYLPWNAS